MRKKVTTSSTTKKDLMEHLSEKRSTARDKNGFREKMNEYGNLCGYWFFSFYFASNKTEREWMIFVIDDQWQHSNEEPRTERETKIL